MEDVELSDLVKQVTDTSDNAVCIRLIEQFFLRRLYTLPEYNLKRMSAVFHEINLRPQINISHLSETACLSSKQFGRIFADYVGTTPKEFIRIIRMQMCIRDSFPFVAQLFHKLIVRCQFPAIQAFQCIICLLYTS